MFEDRLVALTVGKVQIRDPDFAPRQHPRGQGEGRGGKIRRNGPCEGSDALAAPDLPMEPVGGNFVLDPQKVKPRQGDPHVGPFVEEFQIQFKLPLGEGQGKEKRTQELGAGAVDEGPAALHRPPD